MQNPDQGVIFYGIASGASASYARANGTPGTARVFTSGLFRRSDTFYPGAKGTTAITVQGNIGTTAFGVIVGVERQRFDGPNGANSGTPWPWSVVGTLRTDAEYTSGGIYSGIGAITGPPLAFQTITRSQLAGQLVDVVVSGAFGSGSSTSESLAVTLVTPDLFLAGAGASVIVKVCSGGVLLSGDFVVVAADCG